MTRPANASRAARVVARAVVERGVLLHAGNEFPSITSLVCGEPVHGSWWSHPKANLIYWVMETLGEDADLARVKLINGKLCEVHKRLWPALIAIGESREAWQLHGLSPLSMRVLEYAERGPFQIDELPFAHPSAPTASSASLARRSKRPMPGDALRALEKRLLVMAEEVHTDGGRHSKRVLSWGTWRQQRAPEGTAPLPPVASAKAQFEEAVRGFTVRLPWPN